VVKELSEASEEKVSDKPTGSIEEKVVEEPTVAREEKVVEEPTKAIEKSFVKIFYWILILFKLSKKFVRAVIFLVLNSYFDFSFISSFEFGLNSSFEFDVNSSFVLV
jgi:hypothetical protein